MAVGETAKLIASLELANKMGPGLASVNKDLTKMESRAFKAGTQIGTGIKNAGKIAAVGIGLLATQVALGLNSLVKLEQAEAQTGAVLKSTGQAAGQNAADITRLAEKYESLNATIGDEFIRAGENMLLTFTNIKGKAFEPALQSVLDLNTAMGKGPEGLTKTAILVGKALNDPTKGLTALTRVGVSFTKEQVKRIKGLQEEGKTYEAQRIILKELNKEFGGSFAAQGGTTAGRVAKFTDSIEDLQRALATALLPTVGKVADRLSAFLSDPTVIAQVTKLGDKIGSLFSDQNINTGADILKGLFNTARDVAPVIAAAAKVTGEVVRTAVGLFTSLPKELQTLLVGGLAVNKLTGGLVTNLAGGLISSVLKQLVSGVVNVNGGVVNVTGAPGVGGKGGIPPIVGGGAGAAAAGIGGRALAIGAGVGAIAVVIQEASKEAAKAFNEELEKGGITSNFTGQLVGPQGILSGLQNLAEVIRVAGELNKPKPRTPGALPPGGMIGDQGPRTDPKKIEWRNGKIEASVDKTNKAIETLRRGIGADLSNHKNSTKTATIAAGVAAKNAGVKTSAATRAAGITAALASKNAGQVAKSGGLQAAAAIRRKRLSTVVNVNTRLNIDSREWLRQATVTNIRGGAS